MKGLKKMEETTKIEIVIREARNVNIGLLRERIEKFTKEVFPEDDVEWSITKMQNGVFDAPLPQY